MGRISTRSHGMIDYGVAGLFGVLSRSAGLPGAVRSVLGSAAAYHAGYSLLTDYEAGVRPRIGMRAHLALDVLGGMALCAAGVAMKRQPPAARALLVGAGVSELLVAALSERRAERGPGGGVGWFGRMLGQKSSGGVAYPPLDVPKLVADNVWIVDSVLPNALGRLVGVRMTVIRLRNGDLLLHSPTRHLPSLQRALTRLGRIRHLVAPNLAHLSFLPAWQQACPGVTTWAAPGVKMRGVVRRGDLRVDQELAEAAPGAWGGDVSLVMVPGAAGFHEAALFHTRSRTLVLTDLVLNLEPKKVPALLRPLVGWFGSLAPDGMPPPHVRTIFKLRGPEMVGAAQRLLALRPERVIFAHGAWFDRDGTARLRRSLRWALPEDANTAEEPDRLGALLAIGTALLERLAARGGRPGQTSSGDKVVINSAARL